VVCESSVVRVARPRVGGGGRGSGGTGNRALGGSGFPRCLQLPPAGDAARYARIAARSVAPCALSTAIGGGSACTFPRSSVRRKARVALHLPRSFIRWGPPSVRFRIGPPWCLFTRGVEMEVPDLGHSPSRGGGEVGNTEAARSEHVSAGSRGDRAGTAAHSARTRLRGAVRAVCGSCRHIVADERRARGPEPGLGTDSQKPSLPSNLP
jgi:hypothetical protein